MKNIKFLANTNTYTVEYESMCVIDIDGILSLTGRMIEMKIILSNFVGQYISYM